MPIRIVLSRGGRPVLIQELIRYAEGNVGRTLSRMFEELKATGRPENIWTYDVRVTLVRRKTIKLIGESPAPVAAVGPEQAVTRCPAGEGGPISSESAAGVPRKTELSVQERAVRAICKLLSIRPTDRVCLQEACVIGAGHITDRQRRALATPEEFDAALELAKARGWIAEHEGVFKATDIGLEIGRRTRAGRHRPRCLGKI